VNGACHELAIRQYREDMALRRGAGACQSEASEAPLTVRPVYGTRNTGTQPELTGLRERPALPSRDFLPGQWGDFLQG
jgi:hypothetical protein